MEEWNNSQIKKFNSFDRWLQAQIESTKVSLTKCADGSNKIDVLEDRLLSLENLQFELSKVIE